MNAECPTVVVAYGITASLIDRCFEIYAYRQPAGRADIRTRISCMDHTNPQPRHKGGKSQNSKTPFFSFLLVPLSPL